MGGEGRGMAEKQPVPAPAVEVGAPEVGQQDRALRYRMPLPARRQQVEQDRAPALLPHRRKLVRHAADNPGHVISLIGATTSTSPACAPRIDHDFYPAVCVSQTNGWRASCSNATASMATGTTRSIPPTDAPLVNLRALRCHPMVGRGQAHIGGARASAASTDRRDVLSPPSPTAADRRPVAATPPTGGPIVVQELDIVLVVPALHERVHPTCIQAPGTGAAFVPGPSGHRVKECGLPLYATTTLPEPRGKRSVGIPTPIGPSRTSGCPVRPLTDFGGRGRPGPGQP